MTVDITADHDAIRVRLAGDVDLAGESELLDVVRGLDGFEGAKVYVDLSGITFAGSALLNFLARVRAVISERTRLIVCRPSEMVRQVLAVGALTPLTLA